MTHTISTLLTRNLHEVFGEGDAARRRTAIDELFTEDALFYAPDGIHRGREAIDRTAGAVRATHPEFGYTELRPPEDLHGDAGRLQWVAGPAGAAPVYAGTDVIVARDGRIAALYLFFDPLPG
jgi:hypothetical protein